MNNILLLVCGSLFCMFGLFGNASSTRSESVAAQTSVERDPVKLWEQAIEAKGGRERLYAVRNVLESYDDKTTVALYVFPEKLWEWTDYRPTPLGIRMEMDNPQGKLSYKIEEATPNPPPNLGERHAKEALWDNYYAQLYYLLETQWIKPFPVRVYSGTIGGRPVDVLQTLVHYSDAPRTNQAGYRVDFHLDKQSHLPLEVAFPSDDSQGINYGRGTYYVTFADYADVSGIQMPRKVGHLIKPKIPLSVQVNLEYDPGIFERPPSIKAGPDAWRPRKQQN
jgi:hypothetical protein